MKRILTVLGARPQFIKASVVSRAMAAAGGLQEVVVHTGQHFHPGMSDAFFEDLDMVEPAHHLGIHGGSHGAMTGRMLAGVECLLQAEQPDAVIVYGDTNSTLAGALAAVKLHLPVAHVEAGLRSFNLAMPEEVNRILTDRISRWLFVPTQAAQANLRREGVDPSHIIPVGDVMYDVARHHGDQVDARGRVMGRLGLRRRAYALVTVHRAENTDHPERLAALMDAFATVAEQLPVVLPLHPRTRGALEAQGRLEPSTSQVRLIDPVGYLDMVQLEKHAAVIATDSGGVQKEAFFHRVPCVTLRAETEWVELLEAGWNRLAPPDSSGAVAAAMLGAVGSQGKDVSPYGDGEAAGRIVARLREDLVL